MNLCALCRSDDIDEVRFGKLIKDTHSVSVHEKCLYLTTGLFQRGSSMFYNFQKKDILAARQRSTSFICVYCHLKGANIICNEETCDIKFHTGCGISHNVQNQFVGEYASYCHSHVQSPTHQPNPTDKCSICFEDLMAEDGVFTPSKMIQSPCCVNGWYHWTCLQSYALSSGYFFKCPLCSNTTKIRDVAYWGIYMPMRDAAWELEPGAFSELNLRDATCVAAQCHNPNGRNDPTNLFQCIRCGSSPMHLPCLPRNFPVRVNICTSCSTNGSINEDSELDALDYYLLLVNQTETRTSNYHHVSSSDSEDDIFAAFYAQQAMRRNLGITNSNSTGTGTGALSTREEEPLIDVNCRQNTLSSRRTTPERDPLSFESSDSEDEILAAYEAQQATRRMLGVQKTSSTSSGSSRTGKQDLPSSVGAQGVTSTTVDALQGNVNNGNRQSSAQQLSSQGRGRRRTVDQRNQLGNQAAIGTTSENSSRSNLRISPFVAQQAIRTEPNVVEQLRSDGADTQYPSSPKQSSPARRRTRSMTRGNQALLTGIAGGQCVSTHTSTMTVGDSRSIAKQSSPVGGRTRSMNRASQASLLTAGAGSQDVSIQSPTTTVGDSRSIANLENRHPIAQALAGNSCGHSQNQSRHPAAGRSSSDNSNPTRNRSGSNIRRKPLVAQQLIHNEPNAVQHLNSDDAVSLHRSSPKQSSSIVRRTRSMTRQTPLLTANVGGPGASSTSAQPPENQNSGSTLSGNTSATRYRSRSNLRRKPFVAQQVTRSNGADSQYPNSPKQSSPVRGRTRSMTRASQALLTGNSVGQGVSTRNSTTTAGDSRGIVNLENRQPSAQALPRSQPCLLDGIAGAQGVTLTTVDALQGNVNNGNRQSSAQQLSRQGRGRRRTVDQRIQLGKQTAKGIISENSAASRNHFVDQQVAPIAPNVVEHLRSNGADTQYPSSPKQSSPLRRRTRSMTRASQALGTGNAGDLKYRQASARPTSRLGRVRSRRHTVEQRNQIAVGTISGNTSTTRYRSRSNICTKRAVEHSTN